MKQKLIEEFSYSTKINNQAKIAIGFAKKV